jgi:glutaredoxin
MNPTPPTVEPVLYVKTFCPWCWLAKAELNRLGIHYRAINVSRDRAAFEELERISGQTFAPTLRVGEQVLADFGPEQVRPFLRKVGPLPPRSCGCGHRH